MAYLVSSMASCTTHSIIAIVATKMAAAAAAAATVTMHYIATKINKNNTQRGQTKPFTFNIQAYRPRILQKLQRIEFVEDNLCAKN